MLHQTKLATKEFLPDSGEAGPAYAKATAGKTFKNLQSDEAYYLEFLTEWRSLAERQGFEPWVQPFDRTTV